MHADHEFLRTDLASIHFPNDLLKHEGQDPFQKPAPLDQHVLTVLFAL